MDTKRHEIGMPCPEEFPKHHDAEWDRLPDEIKHKAINFLQRYIPDDQKSSLLHMYEKGPIDWASQFHFFGGIQIRNALRANVCFDDKLPSKQWDDYYLACIEVALGVREYCVKETRANLIVFTPFIL
jgi:hypothetical protein